MWQVAITGILLGLAGSLHCVGMCGPLALALPVRATGKLSQATSLLLYNAGRIITYTLLGVVFGLAGRRIYLAGFQQWFSIVLGLVILALLIRFYVLRNSVIPSWMQPFYLHIQQWMGQLLRSPKLIHYLLLGMANGLLPCGMVYLAIAGAVSQQDVLSAALLMFSFGAGTLPAMMVLGLFGLPVKLVIRQQLKKAIPWLMMAMAVVLILRGMNLGIPFISPVLGSVPSHPVSCHE